MSRVLVLGGGLPALAAALDLASVGIEVHVPGDQQWAPEGQVRDPEGDVAMFLAEIEAPIAAGGHGEPGASLVRTAPERVWLRSKKGEWVQQPAPEVFGIPVVPLSSDCIRVLGAGGAFRAYADRVKPVLTIGQQENLGRLVETRMGTAARTLLVEPLIRERFGVSAAEAEVSVVAPGLNEGLSRVGSLSGGADQHSDRHVARETQVVPAAGWQTFTAIVLERLSLFGAQRFEAPVTRLEPSTDGWLVRDDEGTAHRFDAIVVDPASLARLISPAGGAASAPVLGALAEALSPKRLRSYAGTGIQAPTAVPTMTADCRALLSTVTDGSGNVWALRVAKDAGQGWRAELSGPVHGGDGSPTAETVAGLLRTAKLTHDGSGVVIHTAAAPYATEIDRDTDAAALAAWEEAQGNALVAGAELHGDELGAAIAEARQQAVRLRRRLLGISE